jgi:hypothetical protein
VLEFVLVMVATAAVVLVLSSPFRRPRDRGGDPDEVPAASSDVAALEAAKEAKYREIRDAELDHRTGKLSDDDYQAIDTALRAEAITILRSLDKARER